MLGAIALLCKAFAAYIAVKLLDFEVDNAMMLPGRAGVAESATADVTLDVLALPLLGLERLGNFHAGVVGARLFRAAVDAGLGGRC